MDRRSALTIESPAEDVAVSTKLTGLKAGKDYVAEVYVDNRSDSKATVEVNAGTIKESAYTTKSIAQNYVASDQKHAGAMKLPICREFTFRLQRKKKLQH